jgi:hypothetical protein
MVDTPDMVMFSAQAEFIDIPRLCCAGIVENWRVDGAKDASALGAKRTSPY